MRGPWGVWVAVALWSMPAAAREPLPAGNDGIASNYPDDVGIDADPAVVFADDFEGYADPSELSGRWDAAVYQGDQIQLATDAEHVFAGAQALEFNVPQQDSELANATDRAVDGLDVLYLRYYSRIEAPFDVVGSSHNGAMISANYFDNGQATPGVPANGTNKFLVNLENWRGEVEESPPGLINVYIYHPEQRSNFGDLFFPSGTVLPNSSVAYDFGPEFVARPDISVPLDAWVCYEYMVQANAPGQRDGRIAIWIDGELAADFHNLRLRDTEDLRIDRFGLQFHIGSNPNGPARKWVDNVVAATAYIGPLATEDDGGETGGGDSTTGGASDDGGDTGEPEPGSDGGGSEDPSAPANETSGGGAAGTDGAAADADADADGCGCRARPGAGGGWTLALFVLAARLTARRRRPNKPLQHSR